MPATQRLGRYSLFAQLASGGMATVYLGRLNGEVGFGRTVAIKRLHPHLAREHEFVTMFLDEAHLAARVNHPNVAPTLDIVTSDSELFLVMEYIQGESLGALLRFTTEQSTTVPIPIAVAIAIGLVSGLHAAHEATDEEGRPLGIIHRDVSPQNVLVGTDGVPRLVDFGVARAASRLSVTRAGQVKGKVPYMPPEQLSGIVSRQTDIYAAGVVLWESLACRRLYRADSEAELLSKVVAARIKAPSRYNPEVPPELDAIVLKALAREPDARWRTASEMAEALDAALRPASAMRVSEWVQRIAATSLRKKAALVALAEAASEPRGDVAALRMSGALPVLDAAVDSLSDMDQESSVPTVANATDVPSTAGSVVRDPVGMAPVSWRRKHGLSIVAVAFGAIGLAFAFCGRPDAASAPLAAATGATQTGATQTGLPPLVSASAAPTALQPALPQPVVPPPIVAVAVPPASSASAKPVKPSGGRAPAHRAPGELDDLLDTR